MGDPLLDEILFRKVVQQTVHSANEDKKQVDNPVAKDHYHGKQVTWLAGPTEKEAKLGSLFLNKTKGLSPSNL